MHGVQCLGDLAGLVLGGRPGWHLRADLDLLTRAQSAHGLGEPASGDLQGTVAQAYQFDHQAAADAHGDDERRRYGEEAEEDGGPGRSEHAARERVGPVGDCPPGVLFDRPHTVPHARVRPVPGRERCRFLDRPAFGTRGEQLLLGRPHSRVGTAGGEFLPRGAFGAAQVGDGGFGEGSSPVDGAGEQPHPLAAETVGEGGAGQQGVLLGECLARTGELDQHTGIGALIGVLDAAQRAAHAEGRGNRGRVPAVGVLPVRAAVEDGGAQWTEPFGSGHERTEPPGHRGGEFLAVGDGVAVAEAQFRHRAVGACGEFPVVVARDRRRVGGVSYGRAPFSLQGGDGGVDGGPDLGVHALHLPES